MKNVHSKIRKMKKFHRPILLKAFHDFINYQLFKIKNMVSKEQKIKEIKVFIGNNPSLNSNETLKQIQLKGLGIRKQEFQKLFREVKQLPEPTLKKRKASIPIKFRPTKPVKIKVPFEKTKFGIMTKTTQTSFGISEKKAIIIVRKLLKIPKTDFGKLNKKSRDILTQFGY